LLLSLTIMATPYDIELVAAMHEVRRPKSQFVVTYSLSFYSAPVYMHTVQSAPFISN
jgi:hypothetical protein